jgi:two-component system response regulator AtoC
MFAISDMDCLVSFSRWNGEASMGIFRLSMGALDDDRPSLLILGPTGTARSELERRVSRIGHRAVLASTPAAALQLLASRALFGVVVESDGPEATAFAQRIADDWPDLPVVVTTDAAQADVARVAAPHVADVLSQPFTDEELARCLATVAKMAATEAPPAGPPMGELLGDSTPMKQVHDVLRRAAPGPATVLIRGESGTGKELVARTVHRMSARKDAPFVKVQCAALPDTLLESELFGYEKGAFTGAVSRKPGRVDLAQGGTLFLDEIGDVTPMMQLKLLRLLQEREYERLGGSKVLQADVRFVLATHRDLNAMTRSGQFREDLFYRINVVTCWLPPLRARRDDIEPLARHFVAVFGSIHGRPDVSLSTEARMALRAQRWPGNVRQLQNFVEKLVVLSDGPVITAEDVERELSLEHKVFSTQVTGPDSAGKPDGVVSSARPAPPQEVLPLTEEIRQAERRALTRALQQTNGNRTLAARVLGVSRATLYKKLGEQGLL